MTRSDCGQHPDKGGCGKCDNCLASRPLPPPVVPDPIEGLGRPETYGTLWTYSGRRSWWRRFRGLFSGPRRVREGALSAERTPTNPPDPTRLKPLYSWASGPVDDPGDWVKLAEAKRLCVQPGDVVVIRLNKATTYLSAKAMEQIRDEAKVMFPDNRVCLFTLDGDVAVDGSAQTFMSLRRIEQAEAQVAAIERMTGVVRRGFEVFETSPTTADTLDAIGKAATAGCAKQSPRSRRAGRAEEIRVRLKAIDAWYRGVPLPDGPREEWIRLNEELDALNAKAQQPERVFVLASSVEHAESFGRDWAKAKPGRDRRDCVDLLDHLPGSPTHRMPVSPVVRLARSERRAGFDDWLRFLGQRGIDVKCAEEVAACAL